MKRRVLFIEDEPGLIRTVSDRLIAEGYEVEAARDGETGLEKARDEDFDLILLDLMLPGIGGFDVCRDLRQHRVETPILMLTARDRLVDKVLGLKLGADDYLTKPFEPDELLARCEAVLRRHTPRREAGGIHRFGEVRVDLRRATVKHQGDEIQLSGRELALLRYLLEHRGEAISRSELLDQVWGYHHEVSSRTVDVHVVSLRKKIEQDPHRPRFLMTVHGVGYRLMS